MIKKVLFVSRFLTGGGAERVVSVLSGVMEQLGVQAAILQYLKTDEDYYVDPSVKRYFMEESYSEASGNKITRTAKRFKTIRGAVRDFQPDVIIPFLETPVRDVYFATRGMHVPVIATVRNKLIFSNAFSQWMLEQVYGRCDAIFFQTEAQKKCLHEKYLHKCFVVPNPIDESFFQKGAERASHDKIQTIVTAGRLTEQKNHLMLIDAMTIVHKKYPHCQLHIYGFGDMRDSLKEKIAACDADLYIKLMGRTTVLPEVYSKEDLFVLSSDYEGMPNALAEAMAAALPCVSTDCETGPSELIGADERGLLCPLGNAQAFAEKIIWMIEHPNEANVMGELAYKFTSERFSPIRIAEELINQCSGALGIK